MRRMYSKKQLEELISKLSGDLIEVTNIKQLSDEECNGLKVGDIVAKKTGEQYHCYIVTFKQDKGGLCLSYFDASVIETQSYDYTEGHWVYNSEDKTEFSSIGRLPEVTALDNEKVLEVINGAWGKGGKKANVINAPSSTTLTDEEYNQFLKGSLINGSIGGRFNPVVFPNSLYPNLSTSGAGFIISPEADTPKSKIEMWTIDKNTKNFAFVSNLGIHLDATYKSIELFCNKLKINNRIKPQVEVALTNLGTITSTETATGSGFYKNEIPYTAGIDNEAVVNVKMSNGAVYQAFNDTANSKLVIYNGIDFASNSISVSKCWILHY